MKHKNLCPLVLGLCVLLLGATTTRAQITLSGDFQTGTPTPTMTLVQDLELTVTTASTFAGWLVFEDWTVSDGTQTAVVTNPAPQSISFSLDGAPDATTNAVFLIDNDAGVTGNDVTANDGIFEFTALTVSPGQTLTIRSFALTFFSNPNFNPSLPTTFTGNVFLADLAGNQLSEITQVPEPTTGALVLASLAGLALRRQRK